MNVSFSIGIRVLSWQNKAHHVPKMCIKHLGTVRCLFVNRCAKNILDCLGSKCAEILSRFDLLRWFVFAAKEIRTLSRKCCVQICSLFCSTSTGVRMRLIYSFQIAPSYKKECKQVTCCKACLPFKDLKGRFKKTVERLCCSPIIFYRSTYGIRRFCEIPVEFILFE